MKKVWSILITFVLTISTLCFSATAASGTKIKVDGEVVSLVAYNIKDNNYFKLRDIANVLKGTDAHFDVLWNAEKGAIELVSDCDYSTNEELTKEKFETPEIVPSTAKIYKDGNLVLLNAYNINGNTFFKLRDLADVIDFGVNWIQDEAIIEINSSESYVHPGPSGDALALNTEILSLLNKNKAYIDARYEFESTGYNENDYAYNKYQLTVTYEMPVTPESRVIGLDVQIDKLLYNCPKYVRPDALAALFSEYKTGHDPEAHGAYLTGNYCGYELTFWRSADHDTFPVGLCNGFIYLDTPFVSDGTTNKNETGIAFDGNLPFDGNKEFYFSSGVGAWSTILSVNENGAFTGNFHDMNAGEIGAAHPHGTYYTCEFSGRFGNIKKINDTTYSMELLEIYTKDTPGKEWVEESILYVAADPYGLDEGKEFIFYTPDALTNGLSEEFLFWNGSYYDGVPEKLGVYGIENVSAAYGFFSGDAE